MTNPFLIEPLSSEHRRNDFSCGDAALDRYLHELVVQDMRRQSSKCLVALAENGIIAGFYTLATASMSLSELSDDERGSLPRSGIIPAGLISRLAVDQGFRGQGLGGALVLDATFRAAQAEPVVFALLVDAANEMAVHIYEHLGFIRLKSRPATLFTPIETILKAARAPRSSVIPSSRR